MVPGLVESNEILKNDIAQLRRRFKEDKGAAQKQIQMMESQGIYVYVYINTTELYAQYVCIYACIYVYMCVQDLQFIYVCGNSDAIFLFYSTTIYEY